MIGEDDKVKCIMKQELTPQKIISDYNVIPNMVLGLEKQRVASHSR